MDRRGFLKRAGALAVAGAFPLPAPAQLPWKSTSIFYLSEDGIREVGDIDRSTNPWWNNSSKPDFVLASPENYAAIVAAMDDVWRQCTRDLRLQLRP